jgi:hypothetical protein
MAGPRPDRNRRHRGAVAVVAVAALVLSLLGTSARAISAAPVDVSIPTSCGARGGHRPTIDALALARTLTGSDRIALVLRITGGDVPEVADIATTINSTFNWSATMDQNLIDQAAALIPSITASNITATQLVRGPSTGADDTVVNAGPITIRPVAGTAASLPIGTLGSEITTTGGGVITHRVGSLTLDVRLTVTGVGDFDLQLACQVTGSNLIASTTVRDAAAPTFDPAIVRLETTAGQAVEVDVLGDVVTPGLTPLLPESLRIVEAPAAGQATLVDGRFRFTAPAAPGTYATTLEVCGAPGEDSGVPGVDEVQLLQLGANWPAVGRGGGVPLVGDALIPRPVAFSLRMGDEETRLIWAAEHALLPGLPLPLDGIRPSPTNWAPRHAAGMADKYAIETRFKGVAAADVAAALAALPSVGAGNVEVEELKERPDSPNRTTGFRVRFIGARSGQDMPQVTLGQWYGVPPQEALDRISADVAELAGSIGEGPEEPGGPLSGLSPEEADDYIRDKILLSVLGGPPVTDDEWDAWVRIRVIDPLVGAAPAILAFVNGLFPEKIDTLTVEQGEAPVIAEPVCGQGVIEVVVSEVLTVTTLPPGPDGPSPTVPVTAVPVVPTPVGPAVPVAPVPPIVQGATAVRGGAPIGFVG